MIFDTCLSTYFLTYWKTIAFRHFTFGMSRGTEDSYLKSLVKTTFALLLDDVNTGDNREGLNLVQWWRNLTNALNYFGAGAA